MKIVIDIAYDIIKWKQHKEINKKFIKNVLCDIMGRYKNFTAVNNVELSILFTDNQKMKELNTQFRKKNKPTNVLSFPNEDISPNSILDFQTSDDYIYLGDIAFGYDIIHTESSERKISFYEHFTHLLVHAILHLLGFTHDNDNDAQKMETLEIEILNSFAIKSPYSIN